MAAKKSSHWGSFAGGFAESMLASMRMGLMQQHYLALQKHYDALDDHYKRMEALEEKRTGTSLEAQSEGTRKQAEGTFTESAPLKGEDTAMRDHITQWAEANGKNPQEALAIWRQESGGGQNFLGDKGPNGQPSSFGDFQFHFAGINPDMPNEGMGDAFLRDTGIDMRKPENYNNQETRFKAADYALAHASKEGWGAWSNSVKATGVPITWSNAGAGGATTTAALNAPSGEAPAAFIMHHTATRGTPQDIVNGWKHDGKGYGAQYIMDRDGVIHDTAKEFGYNGTNEILNDRTRNLSNDNVVGMEIIAKDDSDVTPAQAKAAADFIAKNYPKTPVYGHGQVNPGHKEATEGATAVKAVTDMRERGGGQSAQAEQPFKPYKVAGPWEPPPAASLPGSESRRAYMDPSVVASERGAVRGQGQPPPSAPPFPAGPSAMPSSPTGVQPGLSAPSSPGTPPPFPAGPSAMPSAPTGVQPGLSAPALPERDLPTPPFPAGPSAMPSSPTGVQPGLSAPTLPERGAGLSSPMVPAPPMVDPEIVARQRGQAPGQAGGPGANAIRRAPPARANVPAVNAQPVSATRAIPARPGWVLIDRPNLPAGGTGRGGGGAPKMGAFDFSTLWGPNPPLSARGVQRGAPPAPQAATPAKYPVDANGIVSAGPNKGIPAGYVLGPDGKYGPPGGVLRTAPAGSPVTPAPRPRPAPAPPPPPPPSTPTPAPAPAPAPATGGDAIASADEDREEQLASEDEQDTAMQMAAMDQPTAARKGGPIRRYANGGPAIPVAPVLRFAAGGASTEGVPMGSNIAQPGYQAWGSGLGWLTSQPGVPNTNINALSGPGISADINALSPAQQSWYNTQMGNRAAQGGGHQWYYNPASYPATPAAAPAAPTPAPAPAPAPIVRPTATITTATPAAMAPGADTTTTGTTTGAFNLPNTVAPKTSPAIADIGATNITGTGSNNTQAANIGNTNYNVAADDMLSKKSGWRRGGQVTPRVTRYDDGGGVSPTIAGMPPGLSGGGSQQAIPPIYFNPATYAGAGAPVGKGVTAASAPTYVAGAIPTLPMFRGGSVGYAGGGGVDPTEGIEQDEASADVGDDDYAYGGSGYGADMGYRGEGRGQAVPIADSGAAPPPAQFGGRQPSSPQEHDPSLPAWTPQVTDGDGNPSRGLIGAIAGGLHYLASALGLGGNQQGAIAGDPGAQTARQRLANGQGVDGQPLPTADEYTRQIPEAIGAGGLSAGLKHLAGMEAVRNFWLEHGDTQKADSYAAAMLQTSVQLARDYGDEAVKKYYNGDLKGAVDAMNQSKDVIADGTIVKATVNPDGKTVTVAGKNLNGEDLWRQVVAPQQILGAALHTANGSLPWHMYEIAAAKYDPQTAALIKARGESRKEDIQQAQTDKAAQAETAVLRGMNQPRPFVTPAGNAPAAPQPVSASVPAPRPAIPPTPQPVQALQPPANQPPVVAQENAPRGGTGGGANAGDRAPEAAAPAGADQGAIPSGPNLPTPQMQPVAETQYQMPLRPDEVEGYAALTPQQQNEVWKTYNAQVQNIKMQQAADAREQGANRREEFSQASQAAREKFAQDQQTTRMREQEKLQGGREKAAADRATQAEADKLKLSQLQPMDPEKQRAIFNRNPQPDSGMSEGSMPADWIANTSHYATNEWGQPVDSKTAKQNFQKDFDDPQGKGGVARANQLENALYNTQAFNPHLSTNEIADLITGGAKGVYQYSIAKTPISLHPDGSDDGFGERYAVHFTSDGGAARTIVMPVDDYNNMFRLTQFSAGKKAALDKPPAQAMPGPPAGPGQTNANNLMLPGIE